MVNRVKSKLMASSPGRSTLFGPPPVLEGEDTGAYEELLARIRAAIKPVNIIGEMLIVDVASLEWELLRWRRLKLSLIRACTHKALELFVDRNLDYHLYSEYFLGDLTKALQDNIAEDQADYARSLAHRCAQNEPDAIEEVEKILPSPRRGELLMFLDIKPNMHSIRSAARSRKTRELVQEYVRGNPDVVNFIHGLLTSARKTMIDLLAETFAEQLDYIERIDRLTTIAENRRNAALREIDRHHAMLGETFRRSVQEIEDAEYKEIEAPIAKKEDAA
jgi:hypothetical protein